MALFVLLVAQPAFASTGTLTVRVEGLPRGERAAVKVVGPRQPGATGRFERTVSASGITRFRGVKVGKYKLIVSPVEIRHRRGTIKRGALALPTQRKLKAKVKRRGGKPAVVRYGTIRNPGVETLAPSAVLKVIGKPRRPRGLVLRGQPDYRRGMLLTAGPSDKLPRGLVARITAVRGGQSRTTVQLRPASIYEVAPNMTFRTKLDLDPIASASAAPTLSCGSGSSIEPFVHFSNAWADGGWITSDVWLLGEVKTGAWLNLDFDTAVGLKMAAIAGVTCSLSMRAVEVKGRAGPIPVYGVIKPTITGRVGAGARMRPEGSVRVELGARVDGVPPSARPTVGFSSPKFKLNAEAFSEVGLGIAINADAGVGVDDGANFHARFGNSLDFTAGNGSCSWDLRLGAFSTEGKLGRWSITTPSSRPLLERNLWRGSCLPPPLSVPLTRAQIAWNGDADVDLYAWDESGRLVYFGDQTGIPDTELVKDVIPDPGEVAHESETFLETANPGRRYTFGVCLFNGDPTDLTMTVPSVPDPRGVPRTFPVHLAGVGASSVVATSPEGGGYSPPAGWCRSTL